MMGANLTATLPASEAIQRELAHLNAVIPAVTRR
jgi:hypothetical protein